MQTCDLLTLKDVAAPLTTAVAVGVAVAGWLGKSYVGGVLHYFSRYTDQIEIMAALKSEISIIIDHVEGLERSGQVAALEKLYKDNPQHRLFIPLYRETIVFDSLKSNVTAITENTLRKVIAFYNLSGGLDVLQTAMVSERFEAFPPERRLRIYEEFLVTARKTADAGLDAVRALDVALSIANARRSFVLIASAILVALIVVLAVRAVEALNNCLAGAQRTTAISLSGGVATSDQWRQYRPHRVSPLATLSHRLSQRPQYSGSALPFQSANSPRQTVRSFAGGRSHGPA
jgi:hypothetical protein